MTLYNRLLIISIPLFMAVVIGMGYALYQSEASKIRDNIMFNQSTLADLQQSRINDYLDFNRERLAAFNSRLLIRRILFKRQSQSLTSEDLAPLQKILLQTKSIVSSFETIHLIGTDGEIVASTEIEQIGQNFRYSYMLEKSAEGAVLGRFEQPEGGPVSMFHAISLYLDGQAVGFLVVSNQAKNIYNILSSASNLGETGESYLVERVSENTARYLSPLSKAGTYALLETFSINETDTDINTAALRNTPFADFNTIDYAGHKSVATVRFIPGVNWGLVVKVDTEETMAPLIKLIEITIAVAVVLILIVCGACMLLARSIANPLVNMALIAKQVEGGDLDATFSSSNIEEIGYLSKVFNKMTDSLRDYSKQLELKVQARTQELAQSNTELSASLNQLKQTQQKLIESEKMASLGTLVAGVAHEVNTPLGSALVSATHYQDSLSYTNNKYKNGTLTEKDFEDLLSVGEETSQITVSNLERASELVKSFKRVAVDQSNDHVETFSLFEYVNQVIKSMRPKYKHLGLNTYVDIKESLQITVAPGAIAQIITNLFTNAIHHGFQDKTHGEIRISANEVDGHVDLMFKDNGDGMSDETLKRVYEPFFTTARGQGGSGLGMHIIYNLVHNSLNGEIDINSELGVGTEIKISFPAAQQ